MKHIAKVLILALAVSLLCVGGASAANDYTGVWEYDDYYTWFEFDADGTWCEYYYEGLGADGYYEASGDTLNMYLWDGSEWFIMDVDDDVMTDDDGNTLFPGELPEFEDSDLADGGFTGVWEYYDGEETGWVQIFEAGTFVLYLENGGAYTFGEVRLLDDDTIGLYEDFDADDDDSIMELTMDDGTLVYGDDAVFERGELPYDTVGGTGEVWEYDDYTIWYEFDANGVWYEYYHDGLAADGYYEESGDTLNLYFWDGTEWGAMDVDDDVMTDGEGDTLFPSELPEFEDSDLADAGFTGVWEFDDDGGKGWYQIFEADTFVLYSEDDGAYAIGEVRLLDDDTIGLYESYEDSDEDSHIELVMDGDVLVYEGDEELVRSELPYDGAEMA